MNAVVRQELVLKRKRIVWIAEVMVETEEKTLLRGREAPAPDHPQKTEVRSAGRTEFEKPRELTETRPEANRRQVLRSGPYVTGEIA